MDTQTLDNQAAPESQDLFTANKGSRLLNHIIDTIAIMIIIYTYAAILVALLGTKPKMSLQVLLSTLAIAIVYYTLFEYFLGKTPGKYLTATKVVNENGERPTFEKIFIRSVSRFIPFNMFSLLFFERAWHDSTSDTYVVYSK